MAMVIVCAVCGAEYEIPSSAIGRGIWRQAECPRCFPPDEPAEETAGTDDDTREAA